MQTLEDEVRLAVGPAGAFLSCRRRDQSEWLRRVRAALDARGLVAFPVVRVDHVTPATAEVDVRFGPATVRRAWAALDAHWPPFVADLAPETEPAVVSSPSRLAAPHTAG